MRLNNRQYISRTIGIGIAFPVTLHSPQEANQYKYPSSNSSTNPQDYYSGQFLIVLIGVIVSFIRAIGRAVEADMSAIVIGWQ
jgi:hypothetical protein